MEKIRCSSSTTFSALYPVVKVWLKMHDIQYEVRESSAGSHYWKTMIYELSPEQLVELLSYLKEAEVLDKVSDISI